MMMTMVFALGTSALASAMPQDATPAHAGTAQGQSVNGGRPQRIGDTPRAGSKARSQHWDDGMNTKRAPDPGRRDEYGTPKVTPPKGQGTNNAGGIPKDKLAPKEHDDE
ncbi:hypothetical protein [Luteibacter sp. UNCMF366Tsu5.1]|uniref:hypothetical protein n=1 Tax=Luteibacter sp. UNCMF366Tsu5.1 TaxID=1502758 RepID=UPI000908D4D2|nr:hypothetical protein [Luteibacter sp. UNCMF366Tsu5.1]SFW22756.1 hypothetical protein SAMN02800691_0410 [Luteibacter sp. UNCMF366Tsu5.1]